MTRRRKFELLLMAVMVFGSVALDQVTKIYFQDTLMRWSDEKDLSLYQGQRYPVFAVGSPLTDDGSSFYFSFSTNYVRNLGAAWGTLSDLPDQVRGPFFFLVTVVAMVTIGVYFRSTPPDRKVAQWALVLILSGAIGNFLNRLYYGYVIDWIDVRWRIFRWRYDFPNFNWADCAITVGVGMLIFDLLIIEQRTRMKSKEGVIHA